MSTATGSSQAVRKLESRHGVFLTCSSAPVVFALVEELKDKPREALSRLTNIVPPLGVTLKRKAAFNLMDLLSPRMSHCDITHDSLEFPKEYSTSDSEEK